jgi:hypothetical protein
MEKELTVLEELAVGGASAEVAGVAGRGRESGGPEELLMDIENK